MNISNITIPFLLIILLVFSGCSSSGNNDGAMKNLTGEAEIVGNEPFTHLAVRVSPDKIYILKCDSTNANLLRQNQGKRVQIFYKSIDDSRQPNVIDVERIILIKSYNKN